MPEALRDPKSGSSFSWKRLARTPSFGALLVGIVASVVLGFDLSSQSYFVDESAYYSQTYYARIFAEGRRNDEVWLALPAYDLPPLPKYLMGAALALGGYKTPGPPEARAWYLDTSKRFDPPGALTLARVPSVILGVLGCVSIYGVGVLFGGRAVGGVSAILLMVNPLYHSHARRAMSDVPCEAFILLGLFCSLWTWQRFRSGRSASVAWLTSLLAGGAAGLALLCKMSGALCLIVAAAWVVISWTVRGPIVSKLGYAIGMGLMAATSAAVFVALNPYMTAHPRQPMPTNLAEIDQLDLVERARFLKNHRLEMAEIQRNGFKHNTMYTPYDKVSTTIVQAFGRFGPFGPRKDDSTIRYDFAQDVGGIAWLPIVLAGAVWAWFRGKQQLEANEAPAGWAVLAYFAVVLTVVTAYLPLAWNRYFLPIQAPSALLAAGVGVAVCEKFWAVITGRKQDFFLLGPGEPSGTGSGCTRPVPVPLGLPVLPRRGGSGAERGQAPPTSLRSVLGASPLSAPEPKMKSPWERKVEA